VHCRGSHLHCTERRREGLTHLARSPPSSRPTLRTAGTLQGFPPSCCGRRVAPWSVFDRHLEKRTTCKQPVNLAVEAAEESLSTLPDYTPTVRPPPKRS
jgi:hypothetical protein